MSTTTADDGSLARRAARGALITISTQISRIGLQLVSVIVFARLLSPEDFGLLALVVAVIGFGELFRDFGLSQATIQAHNLSRAQSSNMFWINSCIGLLLSLILAFLAHPLADFAGDQRIAQVAFALSPVFFLNGLSAQYRADLNRGLQFNKLAVSDLGPAVIGLSLSITAAAFGWGYWALVLNQLGTALLTTLLLPFLCGWIPTKYDRSAPVRALLSFGGNLLGVQALVYVSRNIDKAIIAATLGVGQLGIYDRAYQLLMLPLNQLNAPANRVALPVLSRIAQDTPRYNAYLVRGQKAMLHLLTAIFGLATGVSSVLIPFVLGDQWSQTVPIFAALALAGFSQGAGYVTYWIFLSKGLTRSNLWYTLMTRPIMIMGVLIGSMWGSIGIAWSYSIVLFIMWPAGILWIRRIVEIPARSLIIIGIRCLMIYGSAGLIAYGSMQIVPLEHKLSLLAVGTGSFCMSALLLVLIFGSYRNDLRQLLAMRSFFSRKAG